MREVKCPKCAHKGSVSEFKPIPTKKVFCPQCDVGLTITQAQPDKPVTCPKCKYSGAASSFRETPKPEDGEATEMRGGTQRVDKGKIYKPGKLVLETDADGCWKGSKSLQFSLARGKNTLGRQSSSSSASLQLPTTDTYMSRNHAIIDVVMNADATFAHRFLDNGGKNGTFHKEEKVEPGDIINLFSGDTIRLGHTVLKFVVE
jgi:pSer/pThr/pTyr-binding forkhead associated (FHA) protein